MNRNGKRNITKLVSIMIISILVFCGCALSGPKELKWYEKIVAKGEKKGIFLEAERVDFAEIVEDSTMMTTVRFFKYEYLAESGEYVEMWIYENGNISVWTYPDENKEYDDVIDESYKYKRGKIVDE